MPPPVITNTSALSADNPTLALSLQTGGIGASSMLVELWNADLDVDVTGLTIAFDGSTDGGLTWNTPLAGIRTDTGAIETGSSSPIEVDVLPSAWRCQVDNLTDARIRIVGLTTGTLNCTMRAGSFYSSQPFLQTTSLLAGGSLETPNLLVWELDEIRRILADMSQGKASDYRTPPTPTPLPAIYEAGTNS